MSNNKINILITRSIILPEEYRFCKVGAVVKTVIADVQ